MASSPLSAADRPPTSIGKRSRSNSSSSMASMASSSSSGMSSNGDASPAPLDSTAAAAMRASPSTSFDSGSSAFSASAASSPASMCSVSPSLAPRKARRACRAAMAPCSSGARSSSSDSGPPPPPLPASLGSLDSEDEAVSSLGDTVEALHFAGGNFATATNATAAAAAAPSSMARGGFVDCLVDVAVTTLDSIWSSPLSAGDATVSLREAVCPDATGPAHGGALPLRLFIRETLRRSRTSCSTLQAALLYCVRARPAVLHARRVAAGLPSEAPASAWPGLSSESAEPAEGASSSSPLLCARRMFLAATLLASKFLQDRSYSNRAWARISGLPLRELGAVERAFLHAVGYRLDVGVAEWRRWSASLAGVAAREALAPHLAAASASTVATPTAATPTPASSSSAAAAALLPAVAALAERRRSLARSTSDVVSLAAAPYDAALPGSGATPPAPFPLMRPRASPFGQARFGAVGGGALSFSHAPSVPMAPHAHALPMAPSMGTPKAMLPRRAPAHRTHTSGRASSGRHR